MSYKHISEETVKSMRGKEKNKYSEQKSEVSDVSSWQRYKHCYFEDLTVTHNDYKDPMLVFTVRINYLPAKPVYIDIDNMRELISSLASRFSHPEAKELRSEIIELLTYYRQIT